jgi:hypothetical protein
MSKITELREKRAKVWEQAKAFLDERRGEDDLLSAEDAATYEKMETEVVNLGKEIERLERQAALDLELSQATSQALKTVPGVGEKKQGRATDEYTRAFWKHMRNRGDFEVRNALTIGTDSEGGYLVPDEFERTLIEALEEENIMRQLAKVITTSSGDKKIPVVASKGTAAWVDEEGADGGRITAGCFQGLLQSQHDAESDAVGRTRCPCNGIYGNGLVFQDAGNKEIEGILQNGFCFTVLAHFDGKDFIFADGDRDLHLDIGGEGPHFIGIGSGGHLDLGNGLVSHGIGVGFRRCRQYGLGGRGGAADGVHINAFGFQHFLRKFFHGNGSYTRSFRRSFNDNIGQYTIGDRDRYCDRAPKTLGSGSSTFGFGWFGTGHGAK